MTPLERPAEFAGKEFLTAEELAEVRQKDERHLDLLANGGKGVWAPITSNGSNPEFRPSERR
jgi:hypothetical protein